MRMPNYCGVVRTRDAEFRGFSELSLIARRNFLPLLELTRSRRSKSNPVGDIAISLGRALDFVGDEPFILDICTLDSQSNIQISELLSPADGFKKWVDFAKKQLPRTAIPVVHLEEPFDAANFQRQLSGLLSKFQRIAVRVPSSYADTVVLGACLNDSLPSTAAFIAIGDAGHIKQDTKTAAIARLGEIFEATKGKRQAKFIAISSSFPSSVVAPGYGQDAWGTLPLLELDISRELIAKYSSEDIIHGDYSTVYPDEFTGTVTNWVPRIDYALGESIFYYRVRRPEGGYVECARRLIADPRFDRLPSWATRQILSAASSAPEGKSPAFWISARVNSHIERQARLW